jgi:transcriptional regulator with XRE-family HTH domain
VILRRDSSPRRAEQADPASIPDLARTLRQARLQRGLDLQEAGEACGLSVTQLEDFEAGTVSRLPDRVAVLKGLRRYAEFLELPGDRYVLVLVQHWPDQEEEVLTSTVVAVGASAEPTATNGPLVSVGTPVATDTSLFLVPETLTATAALPAHPATAPNGVAPWSNGAGGDLSTDQVPLILADTGVTPSIRAWRPRSTRDGGDSILVDTLIGFVLVLLVIGTAWLVVNQYQPQWLRAIHLPYTSKSLALATGTGHPGTTIPGQTSGSTVASTTATTTAPTTTTVPKRARRGVAGAAVTITSVFGDHATFSVRAKTFQVELRCVGGPSWVQVSGSSPTPVFVETVPANDTKVFQVQDQLTMLVGSSAARLTILHNKKVIGTYTPPSAPFSMTFTSIS